VLLADSDGGVRERTRHVRVFEERGVLVKCPSGACERLLCCWLTLMGASGERTRHVRAFEERGVLVKCPSGACERLLCCRLTPTGASASGHATFGRLKSVACS